jgi:hypothetical protein
MSYDLFFTEPEISLQQFETYFANRNLYKVENAQAWYENEDTGVYFCFDYSDELVLEPFISNGYAMPAFVLSYTTAPTNVSAFVKGLKPNVGEMEGVAMDQVLNLELVERFRKG